MSADDFTAWAAVMWLERGMHNKEMAAALGCGRNQITRWSKSGAPTYIGLACQALYKDLVPWKREHVIEIIMREVTT